MADADPADRAHVVYAVDARYALPLTVSLLSLQDNSSGVVPVLVLCDEVPPEVRAAILAPLPDPESIRFVDIGAVHDRAYSLFDGQTALLPRGSNGPAPRRFNSGVMLIDTQRWFREGRGPAALQACRDHGVMDQGGLNVACEGAWHALDPEWNVTTQHLIFTRRAARRPDTAIRHLTSIKPWNSEVSVDDRLKWHLDPFYTYLRRAQEARTTMETEGAVK